MTITVSIPESPITLSISIESNTTIDRNEKIMLFNTAIKVITPEGITHLLLS